MRYRGFIVLALLLGSWGMAQATTTVDQPVGGAPTLGNVDPSKRSVYVLDYADTEQRSATQKRRVRRESDLERKMFPSTTQMSSRRMKGTAARNERAYVCRLPTDPENPTSREIFCQASAVWGDTDRMLALLSGVPIKLLERDALIQTSDSLRRARNK